MLILHSLNSADVSRGAAVEISIQQPMQQSPGVVFDASLCDLGTVSTLESISVVCCEQSKRPTNEEIAAAMRLFVEHPMTPEQKLRQIRAALIDENSNKAITV